MKTRFLVLCYNETWQAHECVRLVEGKDVGKVYIDLRVSGPITDLDGKEITFENDKALIGKTFEVLRESVFCYIGHGVSLSPVQFKEVSITTTTVVPIDPTSEVSATSNDKQTR